MRSLCYVFSFCLGLQLFSYIAAAQGEDVLRPHGRKGGYASDDRNNLYRRSPYTIGIEGGLNFNFFSQNLNWVKDPATGQDYIRHGSIFDGLSSAAGFSPHFGIIAGFDFNQNVGIMLRLAYDSKYVIKTTSGTDFSFSLVNGYTEHPMSLTGSITANYISFTPLIKIMASDKLFFTIGPTFHFLTGDVETMWNPTVTDQKAYLDEFLFWAGLGFGNVYSDKRTFRSSDPGLAKAFSPRVGIEGGVGYKIPLSYSVYLVPQARIQYMFTRVLEDNPFNAPTFTGIVTVENTTNKMLHSLQLALAIWFEL